MRRWLRIWAQLWERARNEHSTPVEIGWSVGVGVFCGCTPLLGFHLGIALVLATLLRLNRLWAALGSRISFTPILAAIAFCEIQVAHRIRVGEWAHFSVHEAVQRGPELIGDWLLGSAALGAALAGVVGVTAYALARRRSSVPNP